MVSPTVSPEDADLFYDIWFSILRYVNAKKNIHPDADLEEPRPDNIKSSKDISDALFDEPALFDEYLAAFPSLSPDIQEIVRGFQRFVRGKFVILRHLKSGSVLLDSSYENAYLAKGIRSSIEDSLYMPAPCLVDTVLIPFKGVIIHYGFLKMYNIFMGPGMKRNAKEAYSEIKEEKGLTKTL